MPPLDSLTPTELAKSVAHRSEPPRFERLGSLTLAVASNSLLVSGLL